MTLSTTAGFPRSILTLATKITNADGTTPKTLITAGPDGAMISSLNGINTDTVARYVQLFISKSGVDYLVASIFLNANSGTPGSSSTSILNSIYLPSNAYDSDANKCYRLSAGDSLKIGSNATLASGKEIHITGYGMSY